MAFCRNVATLLWRTLYLQAIRRHYLYTALELLMVPACILPVSQFFDIEFAPLLAPVPLPLENVSFDQVTAVVYGPRTGYTDSLMKPVIDAVWNPAPEYTSGDKKGETPPREPEQPKAIDREADSEPNIQVQKVDSADEVRPACLALVNGTKETRTPRTSPLCVAFHGNAVTGSGPELKLDLVLYTDRYKEFPVTFELGWQDRFDKNSYDDSIWYPAIIFDNLIQESHLALQRKQHKKNGALPKVTIEPLPEWDLQNLVNGSYKAMMFYYIPISSMTVFLLRLQTLNFEFSSGMADYQQIMGLDERQFFVGHFISMMIMLTIENVLAILETYVADLVHPGKVSLLSNVDVTLVFACFTMYAIGLVLQVMAFACVIPKGGKYYYIWAYFVFFLAPFFWGMQVEGSVVKYMLLTRPKKLLPAIYAQNGLRATLRIIFIAQDYEGGAGWDLVWRRVLEKDNITILEIWLVMLAGDVVIVALGWYLSKTLPWASDNPQMPYFFLSPSYWLPREVVVTEAQMQARDPVRFEKMPPQAKPLIITHELTKVFGSNIALDGVELVMYEKTCTVLLGHNGAGKTTLMSILTGILGPTRGVASVAGNDVVLNRRLVRHDVSLCPQFDVFFDDLTVWENLVYFATLKGMPRSDFKDRLTATLKCFNILDKCDNFPSQLSGGMKRRLSLAISLVLRPKLLILDEPTTGLDPEVKRTVWDALQVIDKSETSMLLSTHDMEEADAMADQIIIMAAGKVVCSGSTAFLKKACNVGYVLNITKLSHEPKLADLMAIVKEAAPEAELEDDKQQDVRISLKTLECKNFARMFEALEKSQKKLGVGNVGVTVASMKDVYIRINLSWVPGVSSNQGNIDEDAVAAAGRVVRRQPCLSRRLHAVAAKRLTSFTRSWGHLLMGLVLSVVLLVLLARGDELTDKAHQVHKSGTERTIGESFIPIELSILGGNKPSTLLLGESNATFPGSQHFQLLAEAVGASLKVFKDVDEGARELASNSFYEYMRTVAGGAVYGADRVRVLFNPLSTWSQALLLNMVHQAQLRADSGRPAATLNASYRFVAFPDAPASGRAGMAAPAGEFLTALSWRFIVGMSLSFLVSSFVAMPVVERVSGARDVQLMSGISGSHYVLCHLTVDFAVYAMLLAIWMGALAASASYTLLTLVSIAVILCIYGPSFILVDYMFAELVTTTMGATILVFTVFFFGASAPYIVQVFFEKGPPAFVPYVLLLVPPCGAAATISRVISTRARALHCGLRDSSHDANASHNSGPIATQLYGLIDQQGYSECEDLPTTLLDLLDLRPDGLLINIACVVISTSAFFIILARWFSGSPFCPTRRQAAFAAAEAELDPDVAEEKRTVDALCQAGDFSAHTMVAQNVHKLYEGLHAVRGINVALRPTECFGLLGVNGAGKTTTFQMLAGLSELSQGEAYAEHLRVTVHTREWQSRIGYCFQNDGLLDFMDAYEFLYLLGRLRGIAETDLRTLVDSLITLTDLNEYAHRPCGGYSGGNKRKLSVAAALLGLPPLVFLDEPYAGVDVLARSKIFKGVDRVKKMSGSTIVLTSHSMEECEFSCDRLCIMVAGQMKCLGSLQHIREKFGKGYRFEFMLKHGAGNDPAKFVAAVLELFPGIRVVETHENVCVFILDKKIPWSAIFAKVAFLEKNFLLEHTLIGENTLEQIFIAFAREGENKVAELGDSVTSGAQKKSSPTAHSFEASPAKP